MLQQMAATSYVGRLHLLLLIGGVTPIIQPLARDPALADGNPNIVAQNGETHDCEFYGWSSWSNCIGAEAYGMPTGVHTRKRNVRSPEKGPRGKKCAGPMLDAALCLTRDGSVQGALADAAVNDYLTGAVGAGAENANPDSFQPCMLADWGMWSGCMAEPNPHNAGSFSCGYGSETRLRALRNAPCILGPEVRDAFTDCELEQDGTPRGCKKSVGDEGSLLETRLCPVGVCNVDCVVSEWSGFGDCSKSCGTGTSRRKRALTVSPGGSGLPCPHLVESQNCHMKDCDIDCQVGDFSGWGKCMAIASDSGASSGQISCARNRTRPVLVKRVGTGGECPVLAEYQNCKCPDVLQARQVEGGGFWDKLKNSSSPLVSWIPPTWSWIKARAAQVKSFVFSLKDCPWGGSWWQRALWWTMLGFLSLLALGLIICSCNCCCRCCCKKRRIPKVSHYGSDSGTDLDYSKDDVRRPSCCKRCCRLVFGCSCCCRRREKETRAVDYSEVGDGSDLDTYAGSRYSNGSTLQSSAQDWRSRDANLEGWKEDVPLLSDRPAAREIRPQPGPEAWQQVWQDPALMQTTANLSAAAYAYGQGGPMAAGPGYGYGYGGGYSQPAPPPTSSTVSNGSGYPRDYGQMSGYPAGAMPGYDAMAGYGGAAAGAYGGVPAAYATGVAGNGAAAGAYGSIPAAYATGAAGNGYGGRSDYGDGPTSYGTGATYGPVVHRIVERAPYKIIDTSSGSFIESARPNPGYGEYSPQPTPPQRHYQAQGGAGMRPY